MTLLIVRAWSRTFDMVGWASRLVLSKARGKLRRCMQGAPSLAANEFLARRETYFSLPFIETDGKLRSSLRSTEHYRVAHAGITDAEVEIWIKP